MCVKAKRRTRRRAPFTFCIKKEHHHHHHHHLSVLAFLCAFVHIVQICFGAHDSGCVAATNDGSSTSDIPFLDFVYLFYHGVRGEARCEAAARYR